MPRKAKAGVATRRSALEKHRFAPLLSELREHPTFDWRPMFGSIGCYVFGRMVLVLADRGEPWQGLVLPVERAVHASLQNDVTALRAHSILPKWLYLPESTPRFPSTATEIVARIAGGDERFGVAPTLRRFPRGRREV